MIKDIELIPDSYRGVPITEEWLLRFGFTIKTKHDSFCDYILGKFVVGSIERGDFYLSDGFNIDTPLDYVHQLQNIYFCLTGKELILGNAIEK